MTFIIIMSRYQHGYSQPSLAMPPNRPLFSADPQSYVLLLLIHAKGSAGVHHL